MCYLLTLGNIILIVLQLKRLSTLSTNLPDHFRLSTEDESISVIHAPEGYGSFVSCYGVNQAAMRLTIRRLPRGRACHRNHLGQPTGPPLPHIIMTGTIQ
jgi:hypothetical protein